MLQKNVNTSVAKMSKNATAENKKMRKGFTLIEIVFVAVIIAVMAGLIIPKVLSNAQETQTLSTLQQDTQSLKTAIGKYKMKNGKLKTNLSTADLMNYLPGTIIATGAEDADESFNLYADKDAKNLQFAIGPGADAGNYDVVLQPSNFNSLSSNLKQKMLNKIVKDFKCNSSDSEIDEEQDEIVAGECTL